MSLRDWDEAERHAAALEEYARPEPLPWTTFLAARARAFASFGKGSRDAQLDAEIQRSRAEGVRLGIRLPEISEIFDPGS